MAFSFSTSICRFGSKNFEATWAGAIYESPDAVSSIKETTSLDRTAFGLPITITFFNKQGQRVQQFRRASVALNNKLYFSLDGDVAPYTFELWATKNGERYSLIDGRVSLCDEDGGGDPKPDDGSGQDDGNAGGRGGKSGKIGDLPSRPPVPKDPCLPPQPTAPQSPAIDTPCASGSGTAGPKGFSGS